jgi:hypothetical protein
MSHYGGGYSTIVSSCSIIYKRRNTMKTIGSQKRELLSESGMTLYKKLPKGEVQLKDRNGNLELWVLNDHYAGYVIEIDGKGYEFVRCVS